MNTFVRREILDKSISGDKIFGGEINWIDGLYTDHLAVPHDAGAGGTGSIDGSSFTIGLTDRISLVESNSIGTGDLHVWASDFGSYAAVLQATATQYGTLYLNSAGGPMIQLTANTSNYSYHLPNFVLGSTAKLTPHNFEIQGTSYLAYLYGLYADYGTGFIGDLHIKDHTLAWVQMRVYTQLVDYMKPILDGGVGPLLEDSIQEIVDNVSAWQMSQIANIQDGITTANWYAVSELDQLVSIGANVTFGDIICANLTATGTLNQTGNVDIEGNLEADVLLEESGKRVFVSEQHGEIRGLHLNFKHPLSLGYELVVEQGECLDATKTVRMSITSDFNKVIDIDWAAGAGQGARASSVAYVPNTFYWVHLIYNSSGGAVDWGIDSALNASNLLSDSGYTHYRTLGRVHTNSDGSPKVDFFEEVALYQYTHRPVRSGFRLSGTGVTSPLEVFAGAERYGRFAHVWIQDGAQGSNSLSFKYTFLSPRPSSIDGLNYPSATPCNFMSGHAGGPSLPGEIELNNAADEFICKVYVAGVGKISSSDFGTAGDKGLEKVTAFTLYLYDNTPI